MWEKRVSIYGTLRVPNNFPINRGFSYEKMRQRNRERKTLLTLYKNIKPTTLDFKSNTSPHIQLGDIKAQFKIKLYSLSDSKVS